MDSLVASPSSSVQSRGYTAPDDGEVYVLFDATSDVTGTTLYTSRPSLIVASPAAAPASSHTHTDMGTS